MMRRTKGQLISGFAACALLFTAAAGAADHKAGAATYKKMCVACHGANGEKTTFGKEKIRDLRSPEVQKQTDVELTKVIAGGKGKMPGYGKKLTTQELEDLIAHIRTLKAK